MYEPAKSLLDILNTNFFDKVITKANADLGFMDSGGFRQVCLITLAALNVKIANSLWVTLSNMGVPPDADQVAYLDKFLLDLQQKIFEMRNRYTATKIETEAPMVSPGVASLQ